MWTAPTVNNDLVLAIARRYANSNMTASITLSRPQGLEVDDEGHVVRVVPASLVYRGAARVYTASGPQASESAEESESFSTSYISTPLVDDYGKDVLSQVNDLIEVNEHYDPLMRGRVFRVMDVDAGGQWPVVRRHMVVGAQRFAGWTWLDEQ